VNVTPMGENTLRSTPLQVGHTVRESSVKAWWMSKAVPHSVQR
jgi:hypothetical protein